MRTSHGFAFSLLVCFHFIVVFFSVVMLLVRVCVSCVPQSRASICQTGVSISTCTHNRITVFKTYVFWHKFLWISYFHITVGISSSVLTFSLLFSLSFFSSLFLSLFYLCLTLSFSSFSLFVSLFLPFLLFQFSTQIKCSVWIKAVCLKFVSLRLCICAYYFVGSQRHAFTFHFNFSRKYIHNVNMFFYLIYHFTSSMLG